MSPADEIQKSGPFGAGHFATTRWSLVLAAGQTQFAAIQLPRWRLFAKPTGIRCTPTFADAAMMPTRPKTSRRRSSPGSWKRTIWLLPSSERGKFRSFLLTSLKHFLANEWDRGQAQKRGGGRSPVSIDFGTAEDRYHLEPSHELTAGKDLRPALGA